MPRLSTARAWRHLRLCPLEHWSARTWLPCSFCIGPGWTVDRQKQLTVCVTQTQDQCWLGAITPDTDHDAVRRVLFLDLDPLALARQVAAVQALGNNAFQRRHQCQPLL